MADNKVANSGTGGATFATDEIAGVDYPRSKQVWGVDGTATDVAAGAAALPIQDGGNSITVDGSVGLSAGVNNIGDVDVLTVPADPFGANADAASATGSISAKLRFIAGTGIPITGTVTIASPAVTNAGTFAVQESGAALTALQLIDDTVKTDDAAFTPATDKVVMLGAEFDDTTPDSVDEGDAGALRMSANRNLYVRIRDNAGNERGLNIDASGRALVDASGVAVPVTDNAGSLTVDNTGTFAVQIAANSSVNVSQLAGTTTDTNSGVKSAGTLRVVIATDQPALTNAQPTKELRAATATTSLVGDNVASVQLLALNTNRLGATIQNDSSGILYLKLGTTASLTDYTVRMVQYAYYEVPFGYTGRIDGIWATDPNDGAARITELT